MSASPYLRSPAGRPLEKKRESLQIYDTLYKFYGPQEWWPAKTPFEVIVGAILTQNTAWKNVEKAIANLKAEGLLSSPRKINETPARSLGRIIKPAGYYNVKSHRLKNFRSLLFSNSRGSLSKMADQKMDVLRRELLSVNGIGPETCDSILLYAFEKPIFVVDAYTKRIYSRHGFFRDEAAYDEVQEIFMNDLPKDVRLYNEYHALIVRLGKEFCTKSPLCERCPIKDTKVLANL